MISTDNKKVVKKAPTIQVRRPKFDDISPTIKLMLEQYANKPLFRVSTDSLFEVWLQSFKTAADRQHHNCMTCHQFLARYGNLVIIDDNNSLRSVLWNAEMLPARHPYRTAVENLCNAVERGKVIDQFIWSWEVWGPQEADRAGWTHLHAYMPANHKRKDITAGQAMAEKREDRKHLDLALRDFGNDVLTRALGMLKAGGLDSSEKLVPMCEFLLSTHSELANHKGEARNRVLWRAVAKAPAGWCTPRSSALGALIDDIRSGVSVGEVTRRHNDRMNPTKYMRPTAPPSAGNVKQAEELFEKLGLAPALRRRPALVSEVEALWKPHQGGQPKTGGVFGHLLDRHEDPDHELNTGATRVTFAKFQRDVMPYALEMQVRTPAHGNYCGFTTAVLADAPPILQWDREEQRNPVAWYVYSGGSHASYWGLQGGSWTAVTAVTLLPAVWNGGSEKFRRYNDSAIFLLKGAGDKRLDSLALFPECLKTELHSVRSTIEAHSRVMRRESVEGEQAAGLRTGDSPVTVRVRTSAGWATFSVDRWE